MIEIDTEKRRFAGALSAPTQDRAVALLKSKKLKHFMSKPSSSVLFANAKCNIDKSPTAYVSATLASTIKQSSKSPNAPDKNLCALLFFCTRHTDQYDPHAGPRGLMRSFISQLLSYYTPPLPCLQLAQQIDCEDIEDLCYTFRSIVDTLPRSVILFCIVDGLTSYETRSAYEEDAFILAQSLFQLARGRDRGPVVKVWLSAASHSRNLHSLLADEENLVLPPNVPSSGGLTGSRLSVL